METHSGAKLRQRKILCRTEQTMFIENPLVDRAPANLLADLPTAAPKAPLSEPQSEGEKPFDGSAESEAAQHGELPHCSAWNTWDWR